MRYWFIKRVKGNLNDFSIFTESGHNYDRKLKGGLVTEGVRRSYRRILHRFQACPGRRGEQSYIGARGVMMTAAR
ncbi:hypothetical protein BBD40_13260 [Paenibacillus ihbetae]|uniref:Uncharacterized protein n=1 Tax=Paenibacillus ihbetae TaxID=1870820 RepID=A0ABX3JZY5_9BACL|nr:hypothetical protein BBD40_13260 [Paenibacillus ihbetae]